MMTVKRGKEIKSRNSSHCKMLKFTEEKEWDWDQEERFHKAMEPESNRRRTCWDEGQHRARCKQWS